MNKAALQKAVDTKSQRDSRLKVRPPRICKKGETASRRRSSCPARRRLPTRLLLAGVTVNR